MLSNQHFYYRTIRRNVIAMGNLFKHIQLVRYAKDTYDEIDRIIVPLTYAGKENFISRLYSNLELKKPVQIVLPRMSFYMTDIQYDPSRKLSSYLSLFNKTGTDTVNQQYSGVPYDLTFELLIYVRNVEDGTQIVEQILPYFNPDHTLSMSFVDSMNITRDIPIILENIRYDNDHTGPADETSRILTWTLTFKMKTYFFGPTTTGKIIRNVSANTYYYNDSPESTLEMTVAGTGGFQQGETIYQGTNLPDATVTAKVLEWHPASSKLTITNKVGKFNMSANIHGVMSRTSSTIVNVRPTNQLLQNINITPDPLTANIGDDFGFTEVLNEFPNI